MKDFNFLNHGKLMMSGMNSISIALTDKCNIKCSICSRNCDPSKERIIDRRIWQKICDDLSMTNWQYLLLVAGGEPTVLPDELSSLLQYAEKNQVLTMIQTNGWWGIKDDLIKRFIDDGVYSVNISIDKYHQEFIPISTIHRLTEKLLKNKIIVCYEIVASTQEEADLYQKQNPFKVPVKLQLLKLGERNFDTSIVKEKEKEYYRGGLGLDYSGNVFSTCDMCVGLEKDLPFIGENIFNKSLKEIFKIKCKHYRNNCSPKCAAF